MRILVFSWKDIAHPWAGGSEVNIHEQARRWVEWGHEVTMFTGKFKGLERRETIDGVNIFRAGGRFSIYLIAPFAYIFMLRKRTDLIFDIINGIPFFTPLFSRKPVVAMVHHVHQDMFLIELGPVLGRIGQWIERRAVPALYRKCQFICASNSTSSMLKRCLHNGSDLSTCVVHNGIDLTEYTTGEETKYEKPTILYLGRLKKYKRLPALFSAVRKVHKIVPDCQLLLAGWGDAIIDVEREIEKNGVRNYTKILGHVTEEEKVRLYRKSWVVATASLIEGWGLTVIESNACGTPNVAFDVPGLNESISDGVTGFLASNEDEFVDSLASILLDKDLREQLSANAITWAQGFNWEITAKKTLEVFALALVKETATGLESKLPTISENP
ncbi:MAG: glycosyltransferase family 4 protein [Actinobacteria bacterium]|nr:glycosyltransferase family 4 protein [Actinomycetota bacterium]